MVLRAGETLDIDRALVHLTELDFGPIQSVSEVVYSAAGAPVRGQAAAELGTLVLQVQRAAPIVEPLKGKGPKSRKPRAASVGEPSDSASSAAGEDSGPECSKHSKCLISSESSCPSVDICGFGRRGKARVCAEATYIGAR